jgi:uncharacterized delta-60 repeat protein
MAAYNSGIVVTDIAGWDDGGQGLLVQPDGCIVVVGFASPSWSVDATDLLIMRYLPDGTPDPSFAGGHVLTDTGDGNDYAAWSVVLQPDGKLLVCGNTFVGNTHNFSLIRYNADGSLDTSFNGNGKVFVDIGAGNKYDFSDSVAVQADGKIVVAGTAMEAFIGNQDFAVMRFNADGSLDTSFNGTGKLLTDIDSHSADFANGVLVQADGKIVVSGVTDPSDAGYGMEGFGYPQVFTMVRYNADGSLDTSFNGAGKVVTPLGTSASNIGHCLALQEDGKIVAAGYTLDAGSAAVAVMRYDTDGSLDTSFNGAVTVLTHLVGASYVLVDGLALQADDKIVVAGAASVDGSQELCLARYNSDGSADTSFNGTGVVFTNLSPSLSELAAGVAIQADGKIVLVGSANLESGTGEDVVLLRYNSDGSLDATFNPAGVTLNGSTGADSLVGGSGADWLSGSDGNDTLLGIAGTDTLTGGAGTDHMDGGEGSDLYVVANAADHPAAEISDSGTSGTDEVRFIAPAASTLTLFAGDTGIERVVLGSGTGANADTGTTVSLNVNAAAVANALTIIGNAGWNVLTGTAFGDTIDGGWGVGTDTLVGGAGNDTYFVELRTDVIVEGVGGGVDTVNAYVDCTLAANVENLTLIGDSLKGTGNALANTIFGTFGSDVIDGKAGLDSLDGGDGSDIYLIGAAADHPAAEIHDSGLDGSDEVRFAATKASTLTLFAGDTGIDKVVIGTGTDPFAPAVTRGTAALNIDASAVLNALTVTGNAGANKIVGTAFDDTLAGGLGNDTLTGGAGADTFVFESVPNARSNRDTIVDFQTGIDKLQLSKSVYAALGTPGTLDVTQFWSGAGATAAHDASDRIIYNATTGALYYDADGIGGVAAVQLAILGTTTHPALAFSDVVVIA